MRGIIQLFSLIVILFYCNSLNAQHIEEVIIDNIEPDSTDKKVDIQNVLHESIIPESEDDVQMDTELFLKEVNKNKSNHNTETEDGSEVDTLSGQVLNIDSEEPVFGALVSYKNASLSTLTDADGKYSIPYISNDSLVFKAQGYSDYVVSSNDANSLKIRLGKIASQKISTVVITAMGIERDTRTLSYDLQKIDGASISDVKDPSGNVMAQLNGKVPGLVTTTAAGGVGSPTRILLRGNRSISGNNNALIVIDGVPVDNTFGSQPKDENGGYVGLDGSISINSDDIESVNILKGPSAAALYGGSAANGAILINTKKGSAGPLMIAYHGGASISQPLLHMKFQNQYGRGNEGQYGEMSGFSWGPKANIADPDNVQSFFNKGYQINNSINFSGGTEAFHGFASYTNNHSVGNVGNNQMDAHFINARIGSKIHENLHLNLKVNFSDMTILNRPKTGEVGTMMNAYIIPRDMTKEEFQNYEQTNSLGEVMPAPWPTSNPSIYTNPYWHTNNTSHDIHRSRMILLGSTKYDIASWLNIQARYSLDFLTDKTTGKFASHSVLLAPASGGQYTESVHQRSNQYADILLGMNKYFGSFFNLKANVGASFHHIKGNALSTSANGLNIPNLFIMQNASAPAATSSNSEVMRQGVFATAQLGYKDFMFLDATIRNDWSSTLPKPYNFAYPSVGLTGILSDMMNMPEWINFSKLRASFAVVGNDAPSYIIHQYYSFSPGSGNGFITRDAAKALADLKPESTQSIELGTEWSFLNNKLALIASIYKTNTFNQLLSLSTEPATGFSTKWVNAGNVENKGLEIQVITAPVLTDHFQWKSSLNFSTNESKVISLTPELTETKISGSERLGVINIKEGEPFGAIYGKVWKKDEQGRYLVNSEGLPIVAEDQAIGNFNPKYMLGWINEFKWKNFMLAFQIDGRVGGHVVSGTDAYLGYYGIGDYTTQYREGGLVLDAVHADGSANETPIDAEKLWTTVSGGRTAWTEFFTYDATNFRLRNISVGYEIPLKNKWIERAEVTVNAQNVFFIYKGSAIMNIPGLKDRKIPIDPEMSLGAGNAQGLESGLPPAIRSIGLSFKMFLK